MPLPSPRHLTLLALTLLSLSCTTSAEAQSRRDRSSTPQHRITPSELDQLTNSFADTYVARLSSACEAISRNTTSPTIRLDANHLRLISAASVYSIATSADPLGQLLDLFVLVSLQHRHWSSDDRALKAFGPEGAPLILQAITRNRDEIRTIAEQALRPQQITELDALIEAWREANPEFRFVAFVRFSSIASTRGEALATTVSQGGGFLAPVNAATLQLDRTRQLGERALFLAIRAPILASWLVDDAVNRTLAKPETQTSIQQFDQLNASLVQISRSAAELPAVIQRERLALSSELDRRQMDINASLKTFQQTIQTADTVANSINTAAATGERLVAESRRAAADAKELAASLDKLLASADRVLARFDTPPGSPDRPQPATPFSIADYTAALRELTTAVRESRQLLDSSDQFLTSPALNNALTQVTAATTIRIQQAADGTRQLALFIASLTAALILLTFTLLFAYRYFSHTLQKPSPPST